MYTSSFKLFLLFVIALLLRPWRLYVVFGSRSQGDRWLNWIIGQPEATLRSLKIPAESVSLESPEIDLKAEHSAFTRPKRTNIKPENVQTYSDSPAAIAELRSRLDEILEASQKMAMEEPDQHSPSPGGIHIKRPLSKSTEKYTWFGGLPLLYQLPWVTFPTVLLYIVTMPIFTHLLGIGKDGAKDAIPLCTAFAFYFSFLKAVSLLYAPGLVACLTSLLMSFSAYKVALKPLKFFRLGPAIIRNEPIGWVVMILYACKIIANGLYMTLYVFVTNAISFPPFKNSAAILDVIYVLFMLITWVAIIVLFVFLVPTNFGQNFVFSLSCTFALFSGISYINDVLVYKGWYSSRVIAFDPVLYFSSRCPGNSLQMTFLVTMVIFSVATTQWLNTSGVDVVTAGAHKK